MRKEVVVAALGTVSTIVVVAALLRQWQQQKERQWRKTQRILRKFARECATSVPRLWQISNAMVSDMENSLISNETTTTSTIKLLISYVASLPTGNEEGLYYGVNLRGSNFLILCARLGGKNEPISDIHREEILIPSNVISGTSKELFDYIALHLAQFVVEHPDINDAPKDNKLGFTISYPVEQLAARSGSAIKWENFTADDPVGKELVKDFNQALENHGVDMRAFALVDDTVGDLSGGRYYNKDSVAAITLGMGTNAAYVERAQAVSSKWQKSSEVTISTDWGNFSCSYVPMTEFDVALDAESSNPGSRVFEKLVAGMYVGEIVRRVLLKMAEETELFGECVPLKLKTPYLLRSPDMAAMHQDTSEDRDVVDEKLRDTFGITNTTPMVREVVAEVCDIVAERGARLVGAGIVGILKKLGRIESKKSIVTVEGGLYEHYRVFRNYLHSSVWEMLGSDLSDNVIVEHSHGGSGAGAIFLAACQTQNKNTHIA
ncbi:hypothetical protein ACFE04_002155 [Oxalis oulophora]